MCYDRMFFLVVLVERSTLHTFLSVHFEVSFSFLVCRVAFIIFWNPSLKAFHHALLIPTSLGGH